jgi:hypothetical protein
MGLGIMAAPLLPPVPPIGKDGFQDPVWPKWLNNLHQAVTVVVGNPSAIAVASANGFSGTVDQPTGGVATITLQATTTGLLKGNGQQLVPAKAGVDYLVANQNISVTGDVTGSGSTSIALSLAQYIGQYQQAVGNATNVTNTPSSILSLILTAGDWDVSGVASFAPAGSITNAQVGISASSAGFGTLGTYVLYTTGIGTVTTPVVRVTLTAASVVYLVAACSFTGASATGQGFLRARQVR